MRNVLRYYYNMYCDEIIKKNNTYKIMLNGNTFYFVKYEGNIYNLNDIYNYLLKNNIYCHEIVSNKDNNYITNVDNSSYILIKVYSTDVLIDYMDIANNNILISKDKCRWQDLWIKKIDYYEYQINQFKKKYPHLYQTFSYYSGLTESAIMLANTVKDKVLDIYVEHNRISKNINTIDYYNPLNMIKDIKVRDIAEFFKQQFFYIENPIINVKNYLDYMNITNDEAILFMARLLYPSYYFDIYDEIIQDKIDENKINIITNKVDIYETFLKDVYAYLKLKYNIPEIEWLLIKQ